MQEQISNPTGWQSVYTGAIGCVEQNSKGWERYHRPPGVRLLIEIEKNGKPGLVLGYEHRHEHDGDIRDYRMPGGKVFNSWGEYEKFLQSDPSQDDWMTEIKRAVQEEGQEEIGMTQGLVHVYYRQVAGSTVVWDLYCARVSNAVIDVQSLGEHEDIETAHLDIDEVEALLKQKDQNGNYFIKEHVSRAEIALWVLQNKLWK